MGDAKDFIRELLVVNPKDRLTAAEALNHKWIGRTSFVSTKNLFGSSKPPAGATKSPDKSGSVESVGDDVPEDTMREKLMQYNLDRKTEQPAKLLKAFGLSAGERRFGKFGCTSGMATFGQLHVTTSYLCFLSAIGGTKVKN